MDEVKVYIYALRQKDDEEIRYVGKTIDLKMRLTAHLSSGRAESENPKESWIGKMYKEDHQIEMDIIEECDESSWPDREYYWISHYLNDGHRLTNTVGVETNWITRGGLSKQVALCLSRKMQPVVDEALRAFPDAENPAQALTRALLDWYMERTDDLDSFDRLDEIEKNTQEILDLVKRGSLDRIEAKQEYHEQLLLKICSELEKLDVPNY